MFIVYLFCLQFTVYGLQMITTGRQQLPLGGSKFFTLHSSLFTLHSSFFTLHSSLLTLHSSFPRELGVEVLLESGEIGLRHVDDLFADVDAVVAVHLSDLVEADDEGTVYSHELLWG